MSLVERSRSLQANRRGLEFWVVQWEMGLIINSPQHWANSQMWHLQQVVFNLHRASKPHRELVKKDFVQG